MNKNIFREKSLERIESPEQLNTYIKVINPSIWIILGAIIVLLFGFLVWGFWGDLSIYQSALLVENDGLVKSINSRVLVLVPEANEKSIALGQMVEIDGEQYPICEFTSEDEHLVLVGDSQNEQDMMYAHYLGYDLGDGQNLWLVPFGVDYTGDVPETDDIFFHSRVEIARRSPLSFLFD